MFEVYSKPNCSFCTKAKQLLTNKGEEFKVIDIAEGSIEDQTLARELLINRVIETTGELPKTMPQIFYGDQYVGGYTELAKMLEND